MKRLLAALALAFTASACATGTTNLTLAPAAARPGVLSEAPPTRIDVGPVADQRQRQDRIGDKRNGYGMVMGAVGTTEPPAETIEHALEQVLTANSHILGGQEDRYVLDTTLRNFWFDYRTGLVTVEFFGSVQGDVALVDRTTGQTIYTEAFEGYYSERTGGGLSQTWTRIMNGALTDFATKVSMSEGLKDAIASTHQPAEGTSS
ncbi:MAG TPA: hypothetical protein VEA80_08865 [Vitreimonas sp.]|uniref:hypothetical protein n=1 Tax=Vitreimonas sp. TaxID=3069702 RepID=UPI002D581B9A|nr:hypothetical protein [Vitreimonas sp.]HYD87571.1 hypothetical protein [Vitreimonas sp.]